MATDREVASSDHRPGGGEVSSPKGHDAVRGSGAVTGLRWGYAARRGGGQTASVAGSVAGPRRAGGFCGCAGGDCVGRVATASRGGDPANTRDAVAARPGISGGSPGDNPPSWLP